MPDGLPQGLIIERLVLKGREKTQQGKVRRHRCPQIKSDLAGRNGSADDLLFCQEASHFLPWEKRGGRVHVKTASSGEEREVSISFVLFESKQKGRLIGSHQGALHVPEPEMRDHGTSALRHAVRLGSHHVVAFVEGHLGKHLGHEKDSLAPQPAKHHVDRIHATSTIAPLGQI